MGQANVKVGAVTVGHLEEKKRTYQDNKKARRYAIVLLNCELLGLWGNLKKLCEEQKEIDSEFLSYSSLSKKRTTDENPIKFTTEKGDYQIYIEKLR